MEVTYVSVLVYVFLLNLVFGQFTPTQLTARAVSHLKEIAICPFLPLFMFVVTVRMLITT